ncbi:ZDH24-like protein [Mya arenaria]|uniref:Palmitoyltransferase n=1 Tax=Mya arenaria TaxID=6604 RepID=A0ABY7GEA2_MYAAR|nr:probable palmitoyltransferase ZDHHC24 [Mya arenaria]WAR31461.1 ZDH24-like protein [Mya arenaria]
MSSFKRLLPKNGTDLAATVFTLFGINVIFWFEMLYVRNDIVEAYPDYPIGRLYFHLFCGWYIYLNALSAMWKTIVTDSSTRGMILPTYTRPGWRFCPYCECNAPPRSYHCYTCKACVVRRDHHCVFTGNCIGHRNHRYYMTLVFFCWLAALYASIMNVNIVIRVFAETGPLAIVKIIFPFLVWVFGYIDFGEMLLSAMLLFCMAVTMMVSALLFYHARNMMCGQITTERTHHITKYDLGWPRNVQAVMGKNWSVAWLSPWIPSPLPGDGCDFPVVGEYENPKDI